MGSEMCIRDSHCSAKGRWQLTSELWYHILRAYPYDSNGAFALVVEICLDTSGEINNVAIDAGYFHPSSAMAFSTAICVCPIFSPNMSKNLVRNPVGGPLSMRSLIAVVKPIERSCFRDGTRDNAM